MKRIFWIASICIVACLSSYGQDNSDDQNGDDVYYQDDNSNAPAPDATTTDDANQQAPTYQQFYDQLSPYGQWINYPGYGYCWVPNQLPDDFSPYMTGGHWVYTDYGMTWVSDYAWGWAAFHYGRWFDDPSYGWMWEPGYDWGPAWCMWGEYGGYYCWAPIGPGGVISPHYRPDPHWWHFVDRGHIMDEHIDHFGVKGDVVAGGFHGKIDDINNHISFISHANTYRQGVFFAGPKTEEIQHYTGHAVTKVAINNSAHAGATHVENNKLNVYRPNIQRTTKQPAPANVKNTPDNHPVNRTNNEQPQQHGNVEQHNNARQQPHENTQPQRTQQTWTPPRQSQPKPVEQQPAQRTQQPVQRQQAQPERNFIPSAPRPAQQSAPQRSAPAPSFHPSGGGGGGAHAGGGRH